MVWKILKFHGYLLLLPFFVYCETNIVPDIILTGSTIMKKKQIRQPQHAQMRQTEQQE